MLMRSCTRHVPDRSSTAPERTRPRVRLHARRLDPLHALRLLPAAAPLPLLLPSLETLCAAALQSLAARPTRKA